MRLLTNKTLLWGVTGAWLGALIGFVVLFLQYMYPPVSDLRKELLGGDRSFMMFSHGEFKDRAELVKTTAKALLIAGEPNEAILTIELLNDEEDRTTAFTGLLSQIGTGQTSKVPVQARKANIQILKAAIPRLFPHQNTQVRMLVAVAEAFHDSKASKEARATLQEATQKLQLLPTSASSGPSSRSVDSTQPVTSPKPWLGWWPIGLAVIGFCAATILKPILEVLGKLFVGGLIVRLSHNERLRKVLLSEVESHESTNQNKTL